MCGIVGAFRRTGDVLPTLLDGLKVLEYRGYDSVGVGLVQGPGLTIRRRAGRIDELASRVLAEQAQGGLNGSVAGIGHSRWATHGPPTDENAHPHMDAGGRIALIHNGIIENYAELREELIGAGVEFHSETDTEVLAHLIGRELAAGGRLADAVRRALPRVRGYYAIAALAHEDGEVQLVCAREGPPLCVAVDEDGAWLASDVLAILPHTREVIFLEDGDVAELEPGKVRVTDGKGVEVDRPARTIEWEMEASDKGSFPHYMLKEIHEQPDVVSRTLYERLDLDAGDVRLDGDFWSDESLGNVRRVQVLACGTAFHAGLVARYLIEGLAGVPVDVDYASEFRYRSPILAPGTLALGVSQSGETADTLAALRLAGKLGCARASICNAIGSTMVRESDATLLIHAGPEIGVASTKAFVAMLVAAYLMAVRLGRAHGRISQEEGRELLAGLRQIRPHLEHMLTREAQDHIRDIARRHSSVKGFLFLGRGINYPIALEGALKLKEISYVHAEGYPAGEMKHGPIALIEPGMTTLVIASQDSVADKVRANIEQVRARGGQVIAVGADPGSLELAEDKIEVPEVGPWLSPLLNVVPLQLFSYFVALEKGCDIDKPRNLAKSVTVE